jgi:protein-tyrosine-phosphatase
LLVNKNESSAAVSGPRFRSVLFICAANTARSIMAEHLLRSELGRRGIDRRVIVKSAGIAPYARDGALVSLDTRFALRDDGIHLGEEATSTDLKHHPELLEWADLIIAMTSAQASELVERFPGVAGRRVYTLREFAGEAGDIEDPYEQGEEVFAACREEIKRLLPKVAHRIHGTEPSG